MSKINEKLGLKPAGKRAIMNLPSSRALATAVTHRFCPACGHRWVVENTIRGVVKRLCGWCSATEGFTE